jgi:hypothetical protein
MDQKVTRRGLDYNDTLILQSRSVLKTQFQFDQKVDLAIGKSVRATLRFYNELRKQAVVRGEPSKPPSFETFSTMATGLMEASKQVDLDRLKNLSLRDLFERTWAQKLLNYSTKKLLKDAYETLTKRF